MSSARRGSPRESLLLEGDPLRGDDDAPESYSSSDEERMFAVSVEELDVPRIACEAMECLDDMVRRETRG